MEEKIKAILDGLKLDRSRNDIGEIAGTHFDAKFEQDGVPFRNDGTVCEAALRSDPELVEKAFKAIRDRKAKKDARNAANKILAEAGLAPEQEPTTKTTPVGKMPAERPTEPPPNGAEVQETDEERNAREAEKVAARAALVSFLKGEGETWAGAQKAAKALGFGVTSKANLLELNEREMFVELDQVKVAAAPGSNGS